MPRRPPQTAEEARKFAEWAEKNAAAYVGADPEALDPASCRIRKMHRHWTAVAKNYRADERFFAAREKSQGDPA